MNTAHDLLLSAPDNQVTRSKLIYKAIAEGDWSEAEFHLENAIREAKENGDIAWSKAARSLKRHLAATVDAYVMSR